MTPLRQRPHQTRRKLPKRSHLLAILPRLRTARLPERIPRRNPLHNHTVPKDAKRIPPQTFGAGVPAGGLGVPGYALRSGRETGGVGGGEGRVDAVVEAGSKGWGREGEGERGQEVGEVGEGVADCGHFPAGFG